MFATAGDTIPLVAPEGANCTVVSDTVSFGDNLAVKHQQFLLCDEYSVGLASQPADGIVGLGSAITSSWDGTGENKFDALYWRFVQNGLIPSEEFGLDLHSGVVSGGGITLGGVDKRRYKGGIKTAQLDGELMKVTQSWVAEVQGVTVGGPGGGGGGGGKRSLRTMPGSRKNHTSSSSPSSPSTSREGIPPGVALLDTGTAYIMVPDVDTARALYGKISSEIQPIDERGSWGAACATLDRVARDAVISVGKPGRTVDVKVSRDFFNLGEYPGKRGICQALFLNPLQPAREPLQKRPAWVLGSPFVKGYYTVWNGKAMTIGFAERSEGLGGRWSWSRFGFFMFGN